MTGVTTSLLKLFEHKKLAQFWKECRGIWDKSPTGGTAIKEMVRQAVDIPVEEFLAKVDLASWPGTDGYRDPLEAFADDPSTRFCRSKFATIPCYFVQYAGFEILFHDTASSNTRLRMPG